MHIKGKLFKDTYTFENGKLYLYNDLIIAEIDEGVHVTIDTMLSFFQFFLENYNVPFGYISYRKNSYSIDPQIYKMLPKNDLFKGIAVVSNLKFSSLNAHVEKSFFHGRYEVFTSLDAAVNWLDSIPTQNSNTEIKNNSTY